MYQQKRDVKINSFRILVYSADNMVQKENIRYIIGITY